MPSGKASFSSPSCWQPPSFLASIIFRALTCQIEPESPVRDTTATGNLYKTAGWTLTVLSLAIFIAYLFIGRHPGGFSSEMQDYAIEQQRH